MKRPILIILLGYILGIIVGLYFNKSIVLIYFPIITILFINKKLKKEYNKKLKLLSIRRYLRYLKIYFHLNTIILIIISSIISNTITICLNKEYDKIQEELEKQENISFTGIIISDKEEKEYANKYKIKIQYNKKAIRFYITTSKTIELDYGDKVVFSGTYIKPEEQRNYKGYDYKRYLKQLKIYGTIKCSQIKKISQEYSNPIFQISNKIKKNVKGLLGENKASVFLGLMLGEKDEMQEEIREQFQNASMSHILAVSGMHIGYVILGINFLLKNKLGKNYTNIISIVVLMLYMVITNFSPSITRAGIMGILMLLSKLLHKKNDTVNSMAISLFIILINNPFMIDNLGLQLTYSATLGIIVFNKRIYQMLKDIKIKNKVYLYKIKPKIEKTLDKIKKIIALSFSVQISIFPIIIYNLNIVNPYFFLSNLLLSVVLVPIVIVSFIFLIFSYISIKFSKILVVPIKFSVDILNFISEIGKLPGSKIYFHTPSLFSIISYYIFIVVSFYIYSVYSSKKPNRTQIRVRNLIALLKIYIRNNKKKLKKVIIFLSIILLIFYLCPKSLKINFIDVGQGDSCLIRTPKNKIILIDGGGSINSSFDVGKNTLLPYLLDRGITKIDVIVVSHFDRRPCADGLFTVMKELRVKKVIISKQKEDSENFQKFLKIVKDKNIKIQLVKAGDRIDFENNLYMDILWPTEQLEISDNALNNNSIVAKLVYKNFSVLFTGDIEEVAEKEIVNRYKNSAILKSTVLKVAHHGSKTSSTQEFLNVVNPKYALIGVGKNNNFGHPSDITIQALKNRNCNIYRTDENGEISINMNRKSVGIKKCIEKK